jgi:hypothetical protein
VSCEHLICAHCSGPVAEGRCQMCRAARADLHSHGSSWSLPTAVVLAALLTLLVALALHLHL